ncbi:MAG: ABC transporter ATP-binding protein [Clostridia bacterium]
MLEIKNLNMDYPKKLGVADINLQIQKGQVIGLFGENGMGKTTLIKLLVGIYKPQKGGEILYGGKKLDYKMYNEIAYISEELSLFDDWNIYDHRDFYQLAYENFNYERFNKLLKFFNLAKEMEKVKTFSKGQKAKLELAIGFSKGAKYIFMDEPFLGSDALTRADFLKIMAGFMEEDDTIIIATHLLTEIEQFIDRAIFMRYGKIKADYTAEQLLENNGLMETAKEIFEYDPNKINDIIT